MLGYLCLQLKNSYLLSTRNACIDSIIYSLKMYDIKEKKEWGSVKNVL